MASDSDSDVATLENLGAQQEKVRQHGSCVVLLGDINVHCGLEVRKPQKFENHKSWRG